MRWQTTVVRVHSSILSKCSAASARVPLLHLRQRLRLNPHLNPPRNLPRNLLQHQLHFQHRHQLLCRRPNQHQHQRQSRLRRRRRQSRHRTRANRVPSTSCAINASRVHSIQASRASGAPTPTSANRPCRTAAALLRSPTAARVPLPRLHRCQRRNKRLRRRQHLRRCRRHPQHPVLLRRQRQSRRRLPLLFQLLQSHQRLHHRKDSRVRHMFVVDNVSMTL